jgi:hypothetical protein
MRGGPLPSGLTSSANARSDPARQSGILRPRFLEEINAMCRSIKPLFNFDPPVTAEEIRAAALQFVRKISGSTKPSKANEASFVAAVDDVAEIATRLLSSLESKAPPRNREAEAAKARARAERRYRA